MKALIRSTNPANGVSTIEPPTIPETMIKQTVIYEYSAKPGKISACFVDLNS